MSGLLAVTRPPTPTPDRELADFSYIVAHDLGSCFRQISGFLNLLEDDLGSDLTPRQRDYIDRVFGASKSCRAMLDELLIISRVQQHKLAMVDCNAGALVDDARVELSRQIGESGAVFDIGELGRVPADAKLLTEMFRRVFENAIKFHRAGETPHIAVRRIEDARDWVIHVKDNGPGVPVGQLENVFRMFHRLEPGRPDAGAGAGLTICRRMARQQTGDVVLLPCDDGAHVEIRLPAQAVERSREEQG